MERIKTGIPGLDKLIEGDLSKKESFVYRRPYYKGKRKVIFTSR
jgi:KaiC/GvpD/RAD55 family RecA-like ATPase